MAMARDLVPRLVAISPTSPRSMVGCLQQMCGKKTLREGIRRWGRGDEVEDVYTLDVGGVGRDEKRACVFVGLLWYYHMYIDAKKWLHCLNAHYSLMGRQSSKCNSAKHRTNAKKN